MVGCCQVLSQNLWTLLLLSDSYPSYDSSSPNSLEPRTVSKSKFLRTIEYDHGKRLSRPKLRDDPQTDRRYEKLENFDVRGHRFSFSNTLQQDNSIRPANQINARRGVSKFHRRVPTDRAVLPL
jgi:hypothetical protein